MEAPSSSSLSPLPSVGTEQVVEGAEGSCVLLAGPFITGSISTHTTQGQNPGRTGGAWEPGGGPGDELLALSSRGGLAL